MAWRKLEALGVAKPVWAKWRDPKQQLQLIAVGLLGATVLAVFAGAVLFFWRLLRWWGVPGSNGVTARCPAAMAGCGAVDGALVFVAAIAHVDLSIRDLMQLNAMFSVILVSFAAVTYLGWKLLQVSATADARAQGGGGNKK